MLSSAVIVMVCHYSCSVQKLAWLNAERWRARCRWHPKIRPRSVETRAYRAASVPIDVPERIQTLGVLMYRYQHKQAPRYLTDHCTPLTAVSDPVFRQQASSLHATGSARTAVGLFLLLVRRSGTHCGQLQTVTEDIFIFAALVCSAH